MPTIFINPQGRQNQAILTEDQVERLNKTEGYTVVVNPFKKLRISISDNICTACEG